MHPSIEKSLSLPLAAKLLFAANAISLLFALIMQYAVDILPCFLCLWERVPYAAAAILALVILFLKPSQKQTEMILGLVAVLFAAGAVLAFYHSGVERHWWAGTPSCNTSVDLNGLPIHLQREILLKSGESRCDVIPWSFLGLSIANWNVLLSLALAAFSSAAFLRNRESEKVSVAHS